MKLGPRHTSPQTAQQHAENARDTRDALAARVTGSVVTVSSYTARGDVTKKIPLVSGVNPPSGVLLLRAYANEDAGHTSFASLSPNFYFDAANRSLGVFEPDGLASGLVYTLVFLIVE